MSAEPSAGAGCDGSSAAGPGRRRGGGWTAAFVIVPLVVLVVVAATTIVVTERDRPEQCDRPRPSTSRTAVSSQFCWRWSWRGPSPACCRWDELERIVTDRLEGRVRSPSSSCGRPAGRSSSQRGGGGRQAVRAVGRTPGGRRRSDDRRRGLPARGVVRGPGRRAHGGGLPVPVDPAEQRWWSRPGLQRRRHRAAGGRTAARGDLADHRALALASHPAAHRHAPGPPAHARAGGRARRLSMARSLKPRPMREPGGSSRARRRRSRAGPGRRELRARSQPYERRDYWKAGVDRWSPRARKRGARAARALTGGSDYLSHLSGCCNSKPPSRTWP